jgi:hypothetical protein
MILILPRTRFFLPMDPSLSDLRGKLVPGTRRESWGFWLSDPSLDPSFQRLE